MTGLDQEMMQKNISVKRLVDSQKNIITMAIVLVIVLASKIKFIPRCQLASFLAA